MVPDYEVKLLLDPTVVLGDDHKPTPDVLSTFGMPTSVTKMNVQFVDRDVGHGPDNKPRQELNDAGWNLRIRKIEGEKDWELTYKKRYPVPDDGNIDAAVTTADAEGFDESDRKWEAQVEWGYAKKTLSISRKKKARGPGPSSMDLPGRADSQALLKGEAPGKFADWGVVGWGTAVLGESRIFGPVLARRSVGQWGGLALSIEVWPIKDEDGTGVEYIVEASFKTDDRTEASTNQTELIKLLEEKVWLLKKDSLKTALIMQRY